MTELLQCDQCGGMVSKPMPIRVWGLPGGIVDFCNHKCLTAYLATLPDATPEY